MKLVRDYIVDMNEEFQDSDYYKVLVSDRGLPKDCEAYENAYDNGLLSYINDMLEYNEIVEYKGDYYKLMEVEDDE